MNWNPIKRSPLKPKPREHKESDPWRRKKIRLSGSEMGKLRQDVFVRSEGQCENSFAARAPLSSKRCATKIFWGTFHLAHIISRGRGGSDTPENVLATCPDCHELDTKNIHKLVPHSDWIPTRVHA